MKEHLPFGLVYTIDVLDKDGNVTDSEVIHNLIPTEGLNHTLGVLFKGASQVPTWYIGLYEGVYTPGPTDTAATIAASATECSAYAETSRVPFVSGAVAAGSVDNSASRAEFTMNANKTVYGGFLVSSSTKGGTNGVLLSVVRFTSPKVLESGSVLRVTAGASFSSL